MPHHVMKCRPGPVAGVAVCILKHLPSSPMAVWAVSYTRIHSVAGLGRILQQLSQLPLLVEVIEDVRAPNELPLDEDLHTQGACLAPPCDAIRRGRREACPSQRCLGQQGTAVKAAGCRCSQWAPQPAAPGRWARPQLAWGMVGQWVKVLMPSRSSASASTLRLPYSTSAGAPKLHRINTSTSAQGSESTGSSGTARPCQQAHGSNRAGGRAAR